MTRIVFAIDVTTSVVSISRIAESDAPATPIVSWVDPPLDGGSHRPRATWERASGMADAVVSKVIAAGAPSVVVMAKQQWGGISGWTDPKSKRALVPADPSAGRRIQLHALIEDRLHRAGVPVCEFPYVTALRWAQGHGLKGSSQNSVMTALTEFSGKTWGILPRTELGKDGLPHTRPFRPAVSVLAGIGAMAVGVAVDGIDVTEQRLSVMGGADRKGGNAAVQWPRELLVPSTLKSWDELRRRPEILTVGDRAA